MSTELETLAIERDKLLHEIEQLKQAKTTPESSFSINFHLIDNFGSQMQVTMREGVNMEVIKDVFVARHQFMQMVIDKGYRVPGRASVGETPAIAAPVAPTSAPPPPPAPSNGNGQAAQESLCALIEVGTSYQGGKTQLKFHVNGMEHPLTFTKEVSEMAKLLAPLGYTAAHIVVGQKYPASCMVKWNQGEKYKNVLAVRPA